MGVFVEDWQATYGSPYLVASDDPGAAEVALVEDATLTVHPCGTDSSQHTRVAFVDGVRRGEAALYQQDEATGKFGRGVAGSHGCGAVIADGVERPFVAETRISRLVIWGGGFNREMPVVKGGWEWSCRSIADDAPEAPLAELQQRMRKAEAQLAEGLTNDCLVVVDGPLSYVRDLDRPVIGYVKTHSRALLPPALHQRIPHLAPGERCSLFQLGRDRYSCYMRLAPVTPISGPWAGIVRLEAPQSAGLKEVIGVIDQIAGILPRYAGVPHKDPRAPQNLQPVGALESHLRHLLGDAGLAYRAVRESITALSKEVA